VRGDGGTWLQIRVELLGGRDIVCDPPPGRVMIVGPRHTFAALAEAIDTAFARRDLSPCTASSWQTDARSGFPTTRTTPSGSTMKR
jgi:hypothetical protein